MLLALGVLDLPFDPQETETEIDGRSVTLEPKQGLLLFHEQLSPSEKAKKSEVLISQRHYRLDSRYRYEKGERIDNFTDDKISAGPLLRFNRCPDQPKLLPPKTPSASASAQRVLAA